MLLDLVNQATSPTSTALLVTYASLLALVLSGIVAWTYSATFHGLSFSRNYVQSLILVSVVTATVMQAIGDSIARGLGMMGALAVVRFRTQFTDPKDLIFLFASLAVGIACGIHAWSTGVIGTLFFCLIAWVLYRADIGSHNSFDGLLRFGLALPEENQAQVAAVMKSHVRHFALISLRETGGGQALDYAYQIKLRHGHDVSLLLAGLGKVPSISGLHFMMQESTTEL